mgnify:CR=1 FL=1
MHYHINTIYMLLVIVFAALIYLYVDEFTEKERHVLFVEGSNEYTLQTSAAFSSLLDHDVRYNKIKGKVKIFIKFSNATKNNVIAVRITDINDKVISKEVTFSDDKMGVIEFKASGDEHFFKTQYKTNSAIIVLERIEIEY